VSNLLLNFLGEKRWKALWTALKAETSSAVEPRIPFDAFLTAVLVTLTPVVVTYVDSLRSAEETSSILPTIAFGICAVLALLIRSRLGIRFSTTKSLAKSLSLTHTSVALGCIPAVFIFIFSKTLLADRHDVLARAVGSGGSGTVVSGPWMKIGIVLALAAWVAVTEELIFRGLLVSVIRRTRFLGSQRKRDLLACLASALIFGLAHWPTWGLLPAIALSGLGLGFVLAYIANGEQIAPLVLYHFLFDSLSIAVSLSW